MPDTPIANLLPFIKIHLGDRFSGVSDVTITTAVRLAANGGEIGACSLSGDANSLTPGITDKYTFVLATAAPALLLITPDSAASGLRAGRISTQQGNGQHIVQRLIRLLQVARNGGSERAMKVSQNYGDFLRGVGDFDDFCQRVTQLDQQGVWAALSLSPGGNVVTTGGNLNGVPDNSPTLNIPTP